MNGMAEIKGRVKRRDTGCDCNTKSWFMMLLFFSFFGLAFLVFRTFAYVQALGLVSQEPFLQVLGEHVHHWMVGMFLLPLSLLVLALMKIYNVRNDIIWYFMFSVLGFLVGTIVDGLIGY